MIGIAQLLGSSTQMQCILRSIYRGVTIYPSKLHVSLNLSMIFLDSVDRFYNSLQVM